jgi:hypothetical protein
VGSDALVFIRLTHDRRFVVVVLFLFVVVLVFVRVSGRHRVAMIRKGLQSIDIANSSPPEPAPP